MNIDSLADRVLLRAGRELMERRALSVPSSSTRQRILPLREQFALPAPSL
jgi:hypothetical protein